MARARCRKKKVGGQKTALTCQEPRWSAMPDHKKNLLWKMHDAGSTALEISRVLNCHYQTVERVLAAGKMSVQNLKSNSSYRCSSCGWEVTTDPCLACKLRGLL